MRTRSHSIQYLLAAVAATVLAAEPAPKPAASNPAPALEKKAATPTQTFLLKTDADLDALMAQGNQFASSGQHGAAIEVFQGVIEKAEDRVVLVTTESGWDEPGRLFLSATDAARRALLTGSKELRAEYAARFEGQASAEMEAARAAGDVTALARIAARFPATVAAQRARWWCGSLLSDAGDFASASAAWQEFLALQPVLGAAGADLPLTMSQQALALAHCGQLTSARAMLARLEKECPTTHRTIGGSEQNVLEFTRSAMVALVTAPDGAALPKAFAPTPQWHAQTDVEMAPFVSCSGGRVFVRTLKDVSCLENTTGKRLWEAAALMQETAGASSRVHIGSRTSEREVAGQQRFVIAATPEMVCFVENLPVGMGSDDGRAMIAIGRGGPIAVKANKFAGGNRLTARDACGGKLRWRIGQGEGRDEFTRVARWVSPPSIVGDRVFVIALHIQSYYLVCLDAADGREVWHRLISHRLDGNVNWQSGVDMTSASALEMAGGRILCLTNGGVFACFDQHTGEPRWFCQYTTLMTSGVNVISPTRQGPVNPILTHEQVAVISPADMDQVMAFDIVTGRLLWRQAREQQRFLVGIARERADASPLVILGGSTAAARKLEDGKPVWNKLMEANAGRPVLWHGRLYALTRGRGVVQIDVQSGREVRSSLIAAGELRHLGHGETALMVMGNRSVVALRSLDDAIAEITRRVEAAPDDPLPWRERGELNLRSARIPEAIGDLTKARSLQQKANANCTEINTLLFRCNMEMAARDTGKSLAWLERAGTYAATPAMRSERWLRIADVYEAQRNVKMSRDALQQILDTETGVWLEVPGVNDLAGGRVWNRSMAAHRLEQLAEGQGRATGTGAEKAAQRRLAMAVKQGNLRELTEIIASYPVGETHEQAWLALAARQFEARAFDEVAETLLWFLRAEPGAARRGDAALGVTLAGIRSGRGGLARHGQTLMESVAPKTRVSFGGVSGTVAALRQTLSHEVAPVAKGSESGAGAGGERKAGREVGLLPGANDLAGGRLFIEDRRLMRAGPDGAGVVWSSTTVMEKRAGYDSLPMAAVLLDTVLLFCGGQVTALDLDTGKLLWQERGLRLENVSDVQRSEGLQRVMMLIGASGRSMASNWRMVFVVGNQLIRVKTNGEVASLSPRNAKTIWQIKLPEMGGAWAMAGMREIGGYVVLVGAGAGSAAELRVATLDVKHGRLLAVWDLPKDRPEFSITADGRVQVSVGEVPGNTVRK